MDRVDVERITETLEGIKKLLILQILDRGYSQRQIAFTLGIDQATVSRMFPKGALGKKENSS
jgi:predicted transcriptional regulator